MKIHVPSYPVLKYINDLRDEWKEETEELSDDELDNLIFEWHTCDFIENIYYLEHMHRCALKYKQQRDKYVEMYNTLLPEFRDKIKNTIDELDKEIEDISK